MNECKIDYIRKELNKIWNNKDFVEGIINDFDYEDELDKMIEVIDKNKGKNRTPSFYTIASMNIMYGEGNWEKGQLIEIVGE